jgi:phosphate transport system permease protein
VADLKRNIARRKALDYAFGIVGAFLITASLAVLGVLIADLVRDGSGKLRQTAEVKADGQSPGRRDQVGVVKRADGQGWVFTPDRLPLRLSNPADDPGPLEGKRVVVTGSVEEGDEKRLDAEKVVPLDPAKRLRLRDYTGVLERRQGKGGATEWTLVPSPLRLDLSGVSDMPASSGERVAVQGTRSADGVLALQEIAKLVPQSFFTAMPSRTAHRAGIYSAWVGTCLVMLVTVLTALPLGVGAGIYLEEYASKNWFTAIIEVNIANLAGIPSIIWGLMALGLFVYQFSFGHSILTAGLTLGLLVLPIVIISTREAIRSIPSTIRDASIALGATKWETVRHHVLPYSLGGILTGTIVGMSRAIGETAPLITIGALTYVAFLPDSPVTGQFPYLSFAWLKAPFTVLPIQMFNWLSRPDRAFHQNAAAAGVVLIILTLTMNSTAIYLRYRLRRNIKW